MFPNVDPIKVGISIRQFLRRLTGGDKRGTKEGLHILDICEVRVFDKNGKLKGFRKVVDIITNAGLAEVAGLLLTDVTTGIADFDYIAIGTGTNTPQATDTALQTETHRVAGTGTRVTTTVTNDTAQLVATFSGYSGTEAITEAGVFNAASNGDMLCRQKFNALNVDWDAGDSVEISEKIVCSGA